VEYWEEWAGGWMLLLEGATEYGQIDPNKRCVRLRISGEFQELSDDAKCTPLPPMCDIQPSHNSNNIVVDEVEMTIPRLCIYEIPNGDNDNTGLTQEFIDLKIEEMEKQYSISFKRPRKNWVTIRQKQFHTHGVYREPSRPLHPYTVRLLENKMRRDKKANGAKCHGYAVVYDNGDNDEETKPYLCLGFFG
jgi:hypothetical protein